MPQPTPNSFNPQNRLVSMGASFGSPYAAQYNSGTSIMPDQLSTLLKLARGNATPTAPTAPASPAQDPSNTWFNNPAGYQQYQQEQQKIAIQGGRTPWQDPSSKWYGRQADYETYQKTSGVADLAALSGGAGSYQGGQSPETRTNWNNLSPAEKDKAMQDYYRVTQGGSVNDPEKSPAWAYMTEDERKAAKMKWYDQTRPNISQGSLDYGGNEVAKQFPGGVNPGNQQAYTDALAAYMKNNFGYVGMGY